MKTTIDFVRALKARYGLGSDYAVHKFLGVSKQSVSNWRNGNNFFDDATAIRVAGLLEIEPAYVLACVHQERAKSDAERAAWSSIIERFGGLAASVALGVALGGAPAPAQATASTPGGTVCIM